MALHNEVNHEEQTKNDAGNARMMCRLFKYVKAFAVDRLFYFFRKIAGGYREKIDTSAVYSTKQVLEMFEGSPLNLGHVGRLAERNKFVARNLRILLLALAVNSDANLYRI